MRGLTAVPRSRRQRGLSLVEMMVGIAVGLFIVAAASLLVAGQLSDNRRLLLETQLHQDLRATADIITRELRRAGGWPGAISTVWAPGAAAVANPFATLSPSSTAGSEVSFNYRRQLAGNAATEGPYGFKLDGYTIKTLMSSGAGWQDLTDSTTMKVTSFQITPSTSAAYVLPCPRLCADGTQSCWPTLKVRNLEVAISAESTSDSSVKRSLVTRVRVRNDFVQFNDAAHPLDFCPA